MVSVIIPIYNVEKYLRECIDSVLVQTYADMEIILVDDGSPDNCGKICDEYAAKDSRVSVIHKENGGLSDARNAGLDAARGKYIYFIDSDDYIKPCAIEKMLSRMESENVDIVFFDAETIYEDFGDPGYREEFKRKHTYCTERGAMIFEAQFKNAEYYSCVPLLFFRKAFLDRKKMTFLRGIMHEDELFTALAFIRAERVTQLKEPVYIRRMRAGSIMSSRTSARSVSGLVRCIEGFNGELTKYPLNSIEGRVLTQYIKYMLVVITNRYAMLDKNEKAGLKTELKRLRQTMATVKYLGSLKIRIETKYPSVYMYAKNILKPDK